MSDLETMRAMLKRSEIAWTEHDSDEEGTVVEVKAKTGPYNLGYYEFISILHFDADDTLVTWGCWE